MQTARRTPSTCKVRRLVRGGKRGRGHELQAKGVRVRRPDPRSVVVDAGDRTLTSCGGLVEFGTFVRKSGVRAKLRTLFSGLKCGRRVVYPMHEQLLLLMDAHVAGEGRVFGLESLAADPLFSLLAGGSVPSVDTLYDDLARFDATHLARLEELMAAQALGELARLP